MDREEIRSILASTVSVSEAALLLGVSNHAIYKAVQDGRVAIIALPLQGKVRPAFRIKYSDIDAVIAGGGLLLKQIGVHSIEIKELKSTIAHLQALNTRFIYEFTNCPQWERLTEKQQKIMMGRFTGRSLLSLADEIGVSKERIRQIEGKAWRMMKRPNIRYVDKVKVQYVEMESGKIVDMPRLSDNEKSINSLGLSTRTCMSLLRAGVKTIGEARYLTDATLLDYRNFGIKSLHELKLKLQNANDVMGG